MAKDETKPLDDKTLKADAAAMEGLRGIADYDPKNPAYTLEKAEASETALENARKAKTAAETAWQTASDNLVRKQWAFHNMMLGVKQQVVAQFGDDSDEAQAVGLKKKSEHKRPARKAKKNQPA